MKPIDTTAERAAVAAMNRPKPPDPVLAEVAALRAGVTDLRDALGALRADVVALREALAAKTIAAAVERGQDIV